MEKKNIAILINSLAIGGAERVVSRISEPLSEFYNIYLLLLDEENIAYEYKGTICNVGGNRKSYCGKVIHSVRIINKIIEEKEIECVVSFLDVPNLINSVVVKNCKRIISLRSAFYLKSSFRKGISSSIKLELCRHLFKRADMVIPASKALGKFSISHFSFEEQQVKVIENAFDVDNIIKLSEAEIEEDIEAFIATHKTSIAVGHLEHIKGSAFLLKSFSELCKKEPEAGLLILGKGSLRSELEKLAAELKVENQVYFAGIKSNPFAYIAKSQIYVSTSLMEGFPNALVEAMACGIPVIHTDCLTGPREILMQEYNEKIIKEVEYADYGILVPDFNRADELGIAQEEIIVMYANVWYDLLRNADLREKYSKVVCSRAKYYNMQKCVNKYYEVIEAALSK